MPGLDAGYDRHRRLPAMLSLRQAHLKPGHGDFHPPDPNPPEVPTSVRQGPSCHRSHPQRRRRKITTRAMKAVEKEILKYEVEMRKRVIPPYLKPRGESPSLFTESQSDFESISAQVGTEDDTIANSVNGQNLMVLVSPSLPLFWSIPMITQISGNSRPQKRSGTLTHLGKLPKNKCTTSNNHLLPSSGTPLELDNSILGLLTSLDSIRLVCIADRVDMHICMYGRLPLPKVKLRDEWRDVDLSV